MVHLTDRRHDRDPSELQPLPSRNPSAEGSKRNPSHGRELSLLLLWQLEGEGRAEESRTPYSVANAERHPNGTDLLGGLAQTPPQPETDKKAKEGRHEIPHLLGLLPDEV